jgi:hypothetical protein
MALASGDTNEIVIGASAVGVGSNSVVLGNDSITKTILKGNVGIGTTAPGYKLDVQGGTGVAADKINSRWGYLTNGADYAEYFYTDDADLAAGEAVCVDVTKDNAVKRCNRSGDNNVMGVVSTKPSIVGNHGEDQQTDPEHYKIIGMIGQVAGLVFTENGDIAIGDSLTASSLPGYMRKANAGESTVGIAMQNFNGSKGTIQVLIARRNQSLTVEKVEEAVTANIAAMNIQDQVDNLISQAQANLDAQISETTQSLQEIQAQLALLNPQVDIILAAQTKLQEQVALLTEQAKVSADFIVSLNVTDILYKDAFGNLDLGAGKLSAAEVATETLTIKTDNENNSTIGEATICPAMLEMDADGKCTVEQIDEDEDGVDDNTDNPISNGQSIEIKTSMIKDDSKVYITPIGSTGNQILYLGEITDEEKFEVKIDDAIAKEIKFNWWIVKAE